MDKHKRSADAGLEKFHTALDLLRQKKHLQVADIHKWLSQHLNDACELVTGDRGRTLYFTGALRCELVEREHKLVGVGDAHWDYANTRRRKPDLMAIANLFEGITFSEPTAEHEAGTLQIGVDLDMSKWPTLVDTMLHSHAVSVFTFPMVDEKLHARRIGEIELILKHTYPHISMTQLNIARDIGVIHDQTSLYNLLQELKEQRPYIPTALPTGIEL